MKHRSINLTIDGFEVKAEPGDTILQTAQKNGIYIPNLCNHPQIKPWGACRLCIVENQEGRLVTACETPVDEGMAIISENTRINKTRKILAQLIIANHDWDCLTCAQDNHCQLQEVSSYLDINKEDMGGMRRKEMDIPKDESNPFYIRDLKKCILCGICVRVCDEILGVNAIDYGYRGYETKIVAFGDKPILESNCVSCGECVDACPVGALVPKKSLNPSREIKTICPYCGVGCNIHMGVRGEEIVQIRADNNNKINKGNLCVKGRYGYNFVTHQNRLKSPLIKVNGTFQEVSWDEALKIIVNKFKKCDSEEFAAISSAKCTNEENYIFQKFTRVVMGTNNIDHCARLCHAPSVSGLSQTLGSGAMTNSIEEIADSDCIFAIGCNTTESHPIIGLRMIEAAKNGAKIMVANPKNIELVKHSKIFLQHRPGTDVALLMGMMKFIVDEGLLDESFISQRCSGFIEFKKSLEQFDLSHVSKITGVKEDEIIAAARLFATASTSSIFYAMGITQHSHGTDNVRAISNLSLLTGNLGIPSGGVNPLRGQNNVQGSCDMGALPNVLPGYQPICDPVSLNKFNKAWGTDISNKNGLVLPEIIEGAFEGKIKGIYIMGENPVLSEPNASHVEEALNKVDFLVVQDMFLTETAKLADLVLPACSFAEKQGTYTNTERAVQMIRPALAPRGDSRPDWKIIADLAQYMGADGFNYSTSEDIFNEMTSLTPIYAGISYQQLENGAINWPCPEKGHSGTKILHKDSFNTKDGKGHFVPLSFIPPAEFPDEEYPLLLTTGRCLYQYHTSTMSGLVDGLNVLHGQELVEINQIDADELELNDGDLISIKSRRGEIKARIVISDVVPPGLLSMTFHFPDTPTNVLTNDALDPISKIPELKISSVRIEKL